MDSNRPALILHLPNEILSLILSFAALATKEEYFRYNKEYLSKMTINLMLTCRRFRPVAVPLLYHTISLKFGPLAGDTRPSCHPVSGLHRIIQQNSALGRYCLRIRIATCNRAASMTKNNFDITNDLISYLPNVRVLHLFGGVTGDLASNGCSVYGSTGGAEV